MIHPSLCAFAVFPFFPTVVPPCAPAQSFPLRSSSPFSLCGSDSESVQSDRAGRTDGPLFLFRVGVAAVLVAAAVVVAVLGRGGVGRVAKADHFSVNVNVNARSEISSSVSWFVATMEETLRAHRLALSGLYAQLSPSPTPLLAAEEASLHSAVQELLQTQLSTAQSLLSAAQSTLSTKLALLHSWRTALGEEHATTTEQGPLLFMLNETEHALDRLKSRVQERGLAIIAVQEKLATFTTIFGKEWFRLELDFVKENGWEGIDLRLERLSQLEREVLRCEDELVSPPFPPFLLR